MLLFIFIVVSQLIYSQRNDCIFDATDPILDAASYSIKDGWIKFNDLAIAENDLFGFDDRNNSERSGLIPIAEDNDLQIVRESNESIRGTERKSIRYQQYYKDIPVECGVLIAHWEDCLLKILNGDSVCDLDFDLNNLLPVSVAIQNAISENPSNKFIWEDPVEEQAYKDDEEDQNATLYPSPDLLINCKEQLVYRFSLVSLDPAFSLRLDVDAISGQIIDKRDNQIKCFHSNRIHENCEVRNAVHNSTFEESSITTLLNTTVGSTLNNGTQSLKTKWAYGCYHLKDEIFGPDVETRDAEGSINPQKSFGSCKKMKLEGISNTTWPTTDINCTSTHWSVTNCKEYFSYEHGNSVGAGKKLKVKANFGSASCSGGVSAFYLSNERSMNFGDLMNTPSGASYLGVLDIVGHEYTHFAIEVWGGLEYQGESGALNESFADIFGYMIDRRINGATEWMIGDKAGVAIRDMQNPGSIPIFTGGCGTIPGIAGQPDTYMGANWLATTSPFDDGGVHINSGVQNRWFSLLSEGGLHNDIDVLGISQESAAQIAFYNLVHFMTPNSDYPDSREGSVEAARILFGECSFEHIQTQLAWQACGLGPTTNCITLGWTPEDIELCNDNSNLPLSFTVEGVFECPIIWETQKVYNWNDDQLQVITDTENWDVTTTGTFNEIITVNSVSGSEPGPYFNFNILDCEGNRIGSAWFNVDDCDGLVDPSDPHDQLCAIFEKNHGRVSNEVESNITENRLQQKEEEPHFNHEGFRIHPNPFENSITISGAKNSKCIISDTSGKIIVSQKVITNQHSINSENFQAGIYFIRLVDTDGISSVRKVIKL